MITGKCFPFNDDLVPLLRRAVEASHQQMQVRCQRIHDCYLALECTNNWGHEFGPGYINIHERGE
jgi:hypothetical protein